MRSLLPAPARVHAFVEASLDGANDDVHRLVEEGAAACPRCRRTLCLTGYRRTETPYMLEEILACADCGTQLLLRREERA